METARMDSSECSPLDAGLRAAFGPDSLWPGPAGGVLATLAETVGPCSRVSLRDLADEQPPIAVSPPTELRPSLPGGTRYQIAGEIARGGVGVVLKSRDVDLGRDVAMKVLRPDLAGKASMVQRFVEEAQIAGQLQHPGILPVYELGVHDRRNPYFTMKLVKGQTLAALLHQRPDPAHDRQRFLSIFAQVCQTIGYAHARGVIHRDLKPSNIMVGSFGEVQVVDWGLAKVLAQGGLADERVADEDATVIETVRTGSPAALSMVGAVMGTPAYMSPEQARGDVRRLDERSDVFALGAILCEILTGKPPYVGASAAVLQIAAEGGLAAAYERLDGCAADGELIAIAKRCLAAAPAARPADGGTVARDITEYLESLEARAHHMEIAAAEASAKAVGERRARRLTLALATTGIVAVLLGFGGCFWVDHERRDRQAERTQAVNESIDRAALLLGKARAALPGNEAPWTEVGAATDQLKDVVVDARVDDAARRAETLLREIERAQRDHRVAETLEEAVIVGATHEDQDSWIWMGDQLKAVFAEYGIDVLAQSNDQIAAAIRESPLAIQLADVLELWIATEFHLGSFGVARLQIPELLSKVEILYAADPDPFRTKLRKLIYTGRPDLVELRKLRDSAQFEELRPRTLSWLATAFMMSGDTAATDEVFRKAVLIYPNDFMLNFDFAYVMAMQKRWQEAIPYYVRVLAIRPSTGGVWRALGSALRETGDLRGSVDALNQSIRHQPDHAPTYIDLGQTHLKAEAYDEAIAALEQAIELKADSALAHARLGQALQAKGRIEEALAAFKKSQELGAKTPGWNQPTEEWIRECERQLSEPQP